MKKQIPRIILMLIYLVISSMTVLAQRMPWAEAYENGNVLEIQLVTIDPGAPIYSWWGHTALVVTDTEHDLSRFYNYGLFSFQREGFFKNFAMGRLLFEVGSIPTQMALDHYRNENRSIRIQTLDLPPQTKVEVAMFLEENILPENRQYLYDHYNDNCATRVRDILDASTGGKLAEFTKGPADTSFRKITRRFTHRHWFMDALLMYLMSGVIDDPISRWKTMFLPTELELYIGSLALAGDDGSSPLVMETELWFESLDQPKLLDEAPSPVPRMLLLGLAVGLFVCLPAFFFGGSIGYRIYLGVFAGIVGLAIGIPGTLLSFMSLFTNHTVTFWNENLFLTNIVTLFIIPLGITFAFGKFRKIHLTIWLFHIISSIILILLKIFPAFDQGNWDIIALFVPVYCGFGIGSYLNIRRSIKKTSG